ncbi:MAG: L-threonylcarbamoyladenylate synthase [bacterium]
MPTIKRIDPDNFTTGELTAFAQILKDNGVIAYPTETVYGLGANIFAPQAIERIYELKSRSPGKALSILINDPADLQTFCREIPEVAHALLATFWPGPLTLVLKASDRVPIHIRSEENTIGVRYPDHKLSRALVSLLGAPITSTSANISGQPPPVNADEVLAQLEDKIDGLIDGGACDVQIPSTVVDVSEQTLGLLRPGAIDSVAIEKCAKGVTQ